MSRVRLYISLILMIGTMNSCSNSSFREDTEPGFEEHVFGVRLVGDSTIIERYLDYHQNVWPEVEKGFKKAGYEHIRLFRFGNYIIMVVKVPAGSDLGEMGQISNDSHPRVAEWNKLMDSLQKGLPGTAEGQTWVEMEKIYEYENIN